MTDLPGIILLGLRFGLALCLYAFLFWALRILWRDLRTSSSSNDQVMPALNYEILSSDDPMIYTLESAENLLGRAPECNLQFQQTTVSNLHAHIYYSQKQWWIEDLNSSNGTFLNGIQISQPTVLANLDQLSLGSLEGIIRIETNIERKNQ